MEEISGIKSDDGGFHSGDLWRLKKKLNPRCRDPPTAMVDANGNLATTHKKIEEIAVDAYKKRLENRPIKEGLENLRKVKENLCRERLRDASKKKTPPWTMDDLEKVLNYLKRNKSSDPLGYCNELFRSEVAGKDLKLAILKLMNKIKFKQLYPEILELCDISSIYKLRGSRNSYDNYRGIFRVTILRSILDRLIYNDEYKTIDDNLTDSNVGARKDRNIRDNIFVLNAISNSIINGKEEEVDIQIYDIEKCFDALWAQECINDIYEAGVQNDKLPLLALENNGNVPSK